MRRRRWRSRGGDDGAAADSIPPPSLHRVKSLVSCRWRPSDDEDFHQSTPQPSTSTTAMATQKREKGHHHSSWCAGLPYVRDFRFFSFPQSSLTPHPTNTPFNEYTRRHDNPHTHAHAHTPKRDTRLPGCLFLSLSLSLVTISSDVDGAVEEAVSVRG